VPVVREQLANLPVQILDVAVVVFAAEIGMMPVRLRVVGITGGRLVAGARDFLQHVHLQAERGRYSGSR